MLQKRESLADKLLVRLTKIGLTKRKAQALAKGVAATATRVPVKGTVTGKLEARLIKLGLTQRKAHELAQKLAPTVRAAIKAKARKVQKKLADVDDAFVEEIVTEGVDLTESEELDKVAPRVNGHRVRLDLPVVERSLWQRSPVKGIELLRVMDGYTTRGTYLSAAVKEETGILAIRELGPDWYNVKFYPTMAFWGYDESKCRALGAHSFLRREWYERMHFSKDSTEKLLQEIHKAQRPKITQLAARLLGVTGSALFKAFGYLHKRVGAAA